MTTAERNLSLPINSPIQMQATSPAVVDHSLQMQSTSPAVVDHSLQMQATPPPVVDHSLQMQATSPAVVDHSLQMQSTSPAVVDHSLQMQATPPAVQCLRGYRTRSSQLPAAPPAVVDHPSPAGAAAEDDIHVACDECNMWFLLQETGLTAEEANMLDSFQCSRCQAPDIVCAPKTFPLEQSAQLLCTVMQLIDDALALHFHQEVAATLGLSIPEHFELLRNLGCSTNPEN